MAEQSNIQSAASKSIRPFRSSEEYLYAMKEDLAEWLNTLYDLGIQVDNFMETLETGYDLCQHANNVTRTALEFQQQYPDAAARMRVPQNEVVYQAKNVVAGSFVARVNVSNFIQWCRQDLGIQDVLMFETNDLVLKKNEKNFVLCLLEVARRGSKFGMLAPMLIQMEEEIEEEMRDQIAYVGLETPQHSQDLAPESPVYPSRTQRISLCDLKNLDELPDPPENVVAKPVANNPRRLEVRWQNPSSWPDPESFPLKFFLRYRPLILEQWQHVELSDGTSHTITDAYTGKEYIIQVAAKDNDIGTWSDWSVAVHATPWTEEPKHLTTEAQVTETTTTGTSSFVPPPTTKNCDVEAVVGSGAVAVSWAAGLVLAAAGALCI